MTHRDRGSLVSMANGPATGYALESLQARYPVRLTHGPRVHRHDSGRTLPLRRPSLQPLQDQELGNYRSENKEIDVVSRSRAR